jgi:MtN3 and saliva related transmembrane protein
LTLTTIIGLTAGGISTIAFVPQVLRTWRTKSSGDLSLGMFGLLVLGVVFWLTYGILINDLPIILANVVTLSLQLSVLAMMFQHRRRPGAGAKPT